MKKQITIRREEISLNRKTPISWEMNTAFDGGLHGSLTGHEKQGDRVIMKGHDLAQEPMTRTAVITEAESYTNGNVMLSLTLAD